jgi:glucuronate isomerase
MTTMSSPPPSGQSGGPTNALTHKDRLFPVEAKLRDVARRLYLEIKDLPIISPHGHTDPSWFALNNPFPDPAQLLLVPDHYLLRMLYSQGVKLESLGRAPKDGSGYERDSRTIWRTFARRFYLFRGAPSALWFSHVLNEVFGVHEPLCEKTADSIYDHIDQALKRPEFTPRALFERFKIEVLCTTDSPLDDLAHHHQIRQSGWSRRIIPCFRPDAIVDPEHEDFHVGLAELARLTGEDTEGYAGYRRALVARRQYFRGLGATSTDHGHPTAKTLELSARQAEALFAKIVARRFSALDAERFRAHMLMEMAQMSLEDGLVMQLHPGSFRNHNRLLRERFGRDLGADIPVQTEYVNALRPLLNRFGNNPEFRLILFTLDESTYARELAPLAGHYPALRLGPPWWFHDSPEGMRRFREQVTETAGFYNTVGFNDDTRAFCSIPARHDVSRRIDCAILARWVGEHRLNESEAVEIARALTYDLPKEGYRL